MTAHEFYRNYDIAHPELAPQMSEEQYAMQVRFKIVTLHQRSNVHYTYSTGNVSLSPTELAAGKQQEKTPTGLYSY